MIQIKKTLSIFMAAIFVMAGLMGNITANAAQVLTPAINYVGIGHSPLIVGDTEELTVTSTYDGDVQYRAFMFDGKAWTELTDGYGEAVNAGTPYVLPETAAFELGKSKVSVWVKRSGETGVQSNSNGDFDSYYVAAFNCVNEDDANRVYADGAADYTVNGMKLTFNGIDGISGIEGPYKYQINIMDPLTGVWTKRVTNYEETPSYTFAKEGTYMVVVHANTENSTTWAKYLAEDKTDSNQSSTYGTYEAWKTFMVTVKANVGVEVFNTTIKAASFGAAANVTLTTEGVKEFATATQYQIFDGASKLSAIAKLGEATTIFPAKVAGDLVSVKLLDASGAVLKTIEVKLGESGTITPVVVVPVEEAVIDATVVPASFGAAVTATSTFEGATQYQVFAGASKLSAIANLGEGTTILPAKVVGDTVTIKLFNAAGTIVATNDVVLK